MSRSKHTPKSIRQKRILTVAAENPEASLEDIASEIATATPNVVETVLEEFGDPADDEATIGQSQSTTATTSDGGNPVSSGPSGGESTGGGESGTASVSKTTDSQSSDDQQAETETGTDETAQSGQSSLPDPETLTPKQRETLESIRVNPDATQREIAKILDVSAPTVSNRVNAIPEFDWENRVTFVNGVLGSEAPAVTDEHEPTDAVSGDVDSEADANPDSVSDSDAENETEATEAGSSGSGSDPSSEDHRTQSTGNGNGVSTGTDANATESVDRDAERLDSAAVDPDQIERLIRNLNDLQALLEKTETARATESETADSDADLFDDPELTHKVVHACMQTETISEDEELAIIKQLL